MSPATVAAIREAFEGYGEYGLIDSRLRPAARLVCDDGRRSGLRVEQLLIALKTEWATLLMAAQVPEGPSRTDLTSRFITLCIYEFYAAKAPARATGDEATPPA
jgi:hypothetical protein